MFKVGDKVRCIEDNLASDKLQHGAIYTIIDIHKLFYDIKIDKGVHWWNPIRFAKVEPEPRYDFKVGDLVCCQDVSPSEVSGIKNILVQGGIYKITGIDDDDDTYVSIESYGSTYPYRGHGFRKSRFYPYKGVYREHTNH